MIIRIGLFLMMALGLAGFGTVAWISTHPQHAAVATSPLPVTETVLVAARPLRAGSLLRPEDLDTQVLRKDEAPAGANLDTPAIRGSLMGAMLRRSLGTGAPVVSSDVMRPGDHGFLAAVLAPGLRAVTVGVDAVSGTAGLIWPGDRVDVILTETSSNGGQRISAIRVLSNVRVIAIDQQLVEGVSANSSTVQPIAQTVTLEVTGNDAERVAVAARLGSLSLAVRSADQPTKGSIEDPNRSSAVVWSTDIMPREPMPPTREALTMRVWQGGADAKDYHF